MRRMYADAAVCCSAIILAVCHVTCTKAKAKGKDKTLVVLFENVKYVIQPALMRRHFGTSKLVECDKHVFK